MALGLPVADFSWTPVSAALTYTVGGNTYPYTTQADATVRASDSRYTSYTTPTNTLLTFTATPIVPVGISIIEYRWDFGDATLGFGSVATHTYLAASQSLQVSLTITDNLFRKSIRAKVLNLRQANAIIVSKTLRVAG